MLCCGMNVACIRYVQGYNRGGGGLRGHKHPLGSGVVLVKCPTVMLFPLGSRGGPRELFKFEMRPPFGPVLAMPTPDVIDVCPVCGDVEWGKIEVLCSVC